MASPIRRRRNGSWAAAVESGKVWGDTADLGFDNSHFNRNAVSATAVYNPTDKTTASVKGEVRFDDGSASNGGDQTAYYLAARLSNALNENWRVLAALDAVVSDATELLDWRQLRRGLGRLCLSPGR